MMERKLVRYLCFSAPGSFVANQWTVEVAGNFEADNFDGWPDNAYAFTLHERLDIVDGDSVFRGDPKQIGPTYYHPDSKVEDYEAVSKNPTATEILLSNMRYNGWSHIVWSRWGNWPQPFDPDESIVLEKK